MLFKIALGIAAVIFNVACMMTMSVTLVSLAIAVDSLAWAVYNYKIEWEEIVTAAKNGLGKMYFNLRVKWIFIIPIPVIVPKFTPNWRLVTAIIKFLCDIIITFGGSGAVLGLSGVPGAALAFLFSNFISLAFFVPKKEKHHDVQ